MSKIILVAGGSGSGKTQFTKELIKYTDQQDKFAIISVDNYYNDASHLPLEERRMINWDDPKTINWKQTPYCCWKW